MEPKDNPFLQIDDPYSNVKYQRDEASKSELEFMRLAFETFHVEQSTGKRLMEMMKEKYLYKTLFHPDHPNCKEQALFWEGFKYCITTMNNLGIQHQQYINGVNNNGRTPNTATSSTT